VRRSLGVLFAIIGCRAAFACTGEDPIIAAVPDSSVGDGAAPDASETSDATPDAGPSCTANFCTSFDDASAPIGAGWDEVQATEGGIVDFDTDRFVSAPRGARCSLPSLDAGGVPTYRFARFAKTFPMGTHKVVTARAALFIEDVAVPAGTTMGFLVIEPSKGGVSLERVSTGFQLSLYRFGDAGIETKSYPIAPLPTKKHFHVELSVLFDRVSGSISLKVDGAPAFSERPATLGSDQVLVTSRTLVGLGTDLSMPAMSAMSVDDVTITIGD
jgi:hypothetical protein